VTAATIAFWERRGFVQIDTIDPLPRMATGQRPGDLRSGSQADMGKGTEIKGAVRNRVAERSGARGAKR
jgi:hypothetical protein